MSIKHVAWIVIAAFSGVYIGIAIEHHEAAKNASPECSAVLDESIATTKNCLHELRRIVNALEERHERDR